MPSFRPPLHALGALELPHSYALRHALRRPLRPNTRWTLRTQAPRRCMSDIPPEKKVDPMEEWRNPKPSKWPNRIRLLFLPFIGALIYSMVITNVPYNPKHLLNPSSGPMTPSEPTRQPLPKKTSSSSAKTASPSNRPCVCAWNNS